MNSIFLISSAPSELYGPGGVTPPVAPEVINILLFQRSWPQRDALSEHVVAKGLLYHGKMTAYDNSSPEKLNTQMSTKRLLQFKY